MSSCKGISVVIPVPSGTDPKVVDHHSQHKVNKKSLPERIPAFGIICALIGVTMFSLASLIVKLLTELNSIEILVFRCIFQFIPYFTIICVKSYPIFGISGHRLDLTLRCLTGTISLITLYIAYRLMPLSDSITIYQASPVFVSLFAYLILKERPTIVQAITGVITVAGVFIISKPDFIFGNTNTPDNYDQRCLGVILSITASISSALSLINLRKLKTTPVPVVVMWYSGTVVVIGSAILPLVDTWVMPQGIKTWLLLWGIGMVGVLNQYFQTIALRYESPGPISVTRSFNIVLAFIWEVAIFGQSVQWQSIVGALLISICVVMTAIYKCYQESPKKFEKFFKHWLRLHKTDKISNNIPVETIDGMFVNVTSCKI